MKNAALFLISMVTVAALAGTRARDSNGAAPTDAGEGVALADSVGCRVSARQTDGGTIGGGKMLVHYYDAVNGWTESAQAVHCTVTALTDGGSRSVYVCPDLEPLARYGRIGVSNYGLVNASAATTAPITRVECWGPAIP